MRSKKQGKLVAVTKANSTESVPHGDNKYHQVSDKKPSKFEEIALQVGKLTAEKNLAYGDSFLKCGEFLKLVYPNGIRTEQYTDALCLVRMFDKMMRIGSRKDAFGESPYKDLAGYSLLGIAKDAAK